MNLQLGSSKMRLSYTSGKVIAAKSATMIELV